MIQVTPHIKIYLCRGAVDFRQGIDRLCRICREELIKDPFSGSMFVFRNKRMSSLKILVYDGQGFILFIKRLSSGRFRWWPDEEMEGVIRLSALQLQLLIWNGDPQSAKTAPLWKKISS